METNSEAAVSESHSNRILGDLTEEVMELRLKSVEYDGLMHQVTMLDDHFR